MKSILFRESLIRNQRDMFPINPITRIVYLRQGRLSRRNLAEKLFRSKGVLYFDSREKAVDAEYSPCRNVSPDAVRIMRQSGGYLHIITAMLAKEIRVAIVPRLV